MKDCLDGKLLPISSTDGMTTMEVAEEGEVLKALVDFLYTGSLPREKLQKHVVGLFAAGDNYEIEYLREVCLHHMPASFQSSNAIDFLRIGYNYQLDELRDASLNFIVKNVEELVFSDKYEESASEFPHLSVLITRGCLWVPTEESHKCRLKEHVLWMPEEYLGIGIAMDNTRSRILLPNSYPYKI